jgi:hypothetical protein
MNEHEQTRANQLGRAWDAFVSGTEPHETAPDLLAEIQFVQEILAVPTPAPATRGAVWQQIGGRSLPAAVSAAAAAASPNGVAVTHVLAPAAPTSSRQRDAWLALWRIIAIGAMAGFSAGFLAGIWTRIAMRVAGVLTIDRNRFLLTENDARVGDITVGGTMSLAMFVALSGVFGGLLYVAIRRWLPGPAPHRAVSYGGLLLAVFGFILMDENNPDYQLFGPAWVNVFTFSLTYIVFGILASLFAEWLDAHLGALSLGRSATWRTRLITVVLIPFGFLGMFYILVATLSVAGLERSWILTLAAATAGVAVLALRSTRWSWPQTPVIARLGVAATLVPAFFGVYLTTQGIVGILTG